MFIVPLLFLNHIISFSYTDTLYFLSKKQSSLKPTSSSRSLFLFITTLLHPVDPYVPPIHMRASDAPSRPSLIFSGSSPLRRLLRRRRRSAACFAPTRLALGDLPARMSPLTVRGLLGHLWDLQSVPLLLVPSVHLSFLSASPLAFARLETPALSPPAPPCTGPRLPAHVGPPRGCTGSFCTDSPHPPPDTSFRGRSRRRTGRCEGRVGPGACGKGQTVPLAGGVRGGSWEWTCRIALFS